MTTNNNYQVDSLAINEVAPCALALDNVHLGRLGVCFSPAIGA